MPVLRPLFSQLLITASSYAAKNPLYESAEYKSRIGIPKTSAPGRSYGGSALMDASYIELGPPQNNQTNITANQQRPVDSDGGILKTHTFGTNISYTEDMNPR